MSKSRICNCLSNTLFCIFLIGLAIAVNYIPSPADIIFEVIDTFSSDDTLPVQNHFQKTNFEFKFEKHEKSHHKKFHDSPLSEVLNSVHVFEATSNFDHNPSARVQVAPGWKVVGGGARSNWNVKDTQAYIINSYPGSDRSWVASSRSPRGEFHTVTAYAYAIYDPQNLFDVKIFSQNGGKNGVSVAVEAGYTLTGGGAESLSAHSYLLSSYPFTEHVWAIEYRGEKPNLNAYAIGIKPTSSFDNYRVVTNIIKDSRSIGSSMITGGGFLNSRKFPTLLSAAYFKNPVWVTKTDLDTSNQHGEYYLMSYSLQQKSFKKGMGRRHK